MRLQGKRRSHAATVFATSLALCWLLPATAAAQAVTMYRCTDALGRVTIQNDEPCPKGSRQEKREVSIDATAAPFPKPLPEIAPIVPTQPQAPEPAAAGADDIPRVLPLPEAETPRADRLPPPPLFRCRTIENDSYLADTGEPRERCLAIDTVGIDGRQQLGAGRACTVVHDQCQRVPDEDACDAWRQRVNQAQSAWTFARADSRAELKAEYERIARVVAETTCNQ